MINPIDLQVSYDAHFDELRVDFSHILQLVEPDTDKLSLEAFQNQLQQQINLISKSLKYQKLSVALDKAKESIADYLNALIRHKYIRFIGETDQVAMAFVAVGSGICKPMYVPVRLLDRPEPKVEERYQHYDNGHIYRIVSVSTMWGRSPHRGEKIVTYEKNGEEFSRTLDDFMGLSLYKGKPVHTFSRVG
jgi:hypothetical protein